MEWLGGEEGDASGGAARGGGEGGGAVPGEGADVMDVVRSIRVALDAAGALMDQHYR